MNGGDRGTPASTGSRQLPLPNTMPAMIAYLDLPSGISGDIFLSCLVDAGWELSRLQAVIDSLKLPESCKVEATRVLGALGDINEVIVVGIGKGGDDGTGEAAVIKGHERRGQALGPSPPASLGDKIIT